MEKNKKTADNTMEEKGIDSEVAEEMRIIEEAEENTIGKKVEAKTEEVIADNEKWKNRAGEIKNKTEADSIWKEFEELNKEATEEESKYHQTIKENIEETEEIILPDKAEEAAEATETKNNTEPQESGEEDNKENKQEGQAETKKKIIDLGQEEKARLIIEGEDKEKALNFLQGLLRMGIGGTEEIIPPDKIGKLASKESEGVLSFIYKSIGQDCVITASFPDANNKNLVLIEMTVTPNGENMEESLDGFLEDLPEGEIFDRLIRQSNAEYDKAREREDDYNKMDYESKEREANEYLKEYKDKYGQIDYSEKQNEIIQKIEEKRTSDEFEQIQKDFEDVIGKAGDISRIENENDIEKINALLNELADQVDLYADWLELNFIKSAGDDPESQQFREFVEKICMTEKITIDELRRGANVMRQGVEAMTEEDKTFFKKLLEKLSDLKIIPAGIGLAALTTLVFLTKKFAEIESSKTAVIAGKSGVYFGTGYSMAKLSGITLTGKFLIPGGLLALFATLIPGHKRDDFFKWLTGLSVPGWLASPKK